MDNQQVTATELAWLSGIWDGEGTISIRRILQKNGKRKPQYSPRVGVVNTSTKMIAEIRRILDLLEIQYYFQERPESRKGLGNKQIWEISIDTLGNALRLLVRLRPHLIAKDFQADCLIEFCERRSKVLDRRKHNNKARQYQPRDYDLVAQIVDANGNRAGTSETIREDAQRAKI